MRRLLVPAFLCYSIPFALAQGVPVTKVIELYNGAAIEGQIIDETDGQISLQLRNGLVLRLSRDSVQAILDPSDLVLEEDEEIILEATDVLDLSKIFDVPNPTPTPLTIVPLDLRLNFKLQRDRDPTTLRPLPPILADPNQEEETEDSQPEYSAIGEDYGRVVWTQGLSKYRPAGGVWRPTLTATSIAIGDQVNTLSGRAQILSEVGILTRLHAATQAVFLAEGIRIDEGKAWIRNPLEEPSWVLLDGIKVTIEEAVLNVEFLKTGYKIVLLEGKATLDKLPEDEVIQDDLEGPTSLLLDINRNVLRQTEPSENNLQEWQAWEANTPQPDPSSMQRDSGMEETLADFEIRFLNQLEDLQTLAEAVLAFYLDMGKFPQEKRPFLSELSTNPDSPDWRGPYLVTMTPPILDRWGSELVYRIRTDPISAEVQAEIYALGPNKQFERGEGDDVGIAIPRPGS